MKAVRIDGITKEEYGRNLEENISTLIERLKKKFYKLKLARLVEILKDNVNGSFRKEPDAGKLHIRNSVRDVRS